MDIVIGLKTYLGAWIDLIFDDKNGHVLYVIKIRDAGGVIFYWIFIGT